MGSTVAVSVTGSGSVAAWPERVEPVAQLGRAGGALLDRGLVLGHALADRGEGLQHGHGRVVGRGVTGGGGVEAGQDIGLHRARVEVGTCVGDCLADDVRVLVCGGLAELGEEVVEEAQGSVPPGSVQ